MNYAEEVAADRRRLILKALEHAAAYTAPRQLVGAFLGSLGRNAPADVLTGDMAWLQRNGLVEPAPADCWRLTRAGLDVAKDVVQYPGVRRPLPGE